MVLFPRPLYDVLLLLCLWLLYSSSPEKVSPGGVLDLCLYMASSASSKEDSDPGDDRLRRARRRRSSFGSESSSEDTKDVTYRQRSRTPPSETFSGDEEYSSHRRKNKSSLHRGLGNKAMNEALNQVAKSSFTRRIEGASLPR